MPEKKQNDDARAKFLAALEKKQLKRAAGSATGPLTGSKIGGGQATGSASKRFQRKSGSA